MPVRILTSLFLLLPWALAALAAAPTQYEVAKIPASLQENANAVIRMHHTAFTVNSASSATEKVKYAVTVLNEKAADHSTLAVPYDKSIKVNYIKASVYNALGLPVKQLKKSDIQDQSAVSNISVHEDNRIKYATLTLPQYPYTVEFEYEVSYSVSLVCPKWAPQSDEFVSVESASFAVVAPASLDFRYKEVNLPKKGTTSSDNGTKTYLWELSQVPAKKSESSRPPFHELIPMVYTAPADFEYGTYKGSMRDWASFGEWFNQLNADRDRLPPATVEKIKQLVGSEKDEYTKIRKVYEYM